MRAASCFIKHVSPKPTRATSLFEWPATWTLIMRLTWAGLAQDAASIGAISVKLLGEGPAMSLVKHLSLGSHNLRGQRITTCRLCSFALALWAKAAPSLQAGPASWTPTNRGACVGQWSHCSAPGSCCKLGRLVQTGRLPDSPPPTLQQVELAQARPARPGGVQPGSSS